MKQMKEWSLWLLIVLMIPLSLMGCSSDDDDNKDDELVKKAVGTWMCTQSRDTQKDGSYYDGLMIGQQIVIKKDSTFTSTAPTFGYSGTYTVNGNKITAKSNSGTFVVTVTINGDKMTWEGTASNGVRFKYVFIRE